MNGRMTQVHGGRLVAQALKRHDITHLFTLCGGHIQAIYDGCLDEGIRVVDVRHEQTAAHAADGYARMTGKPGVCAVTAGPGVTDAVTAVANAQRAQVPLIVIGGAGPRVLADMGSLQDMNHVELMRSITKWSVTVASTDRLQEYIDAAFRIAQGNVPGPVFLEIPLDVLMNFASDNPPASAPQAPPRPGPSASQLQEVAELFNVAERPVLLLGTQVRWSPVKDLVPSFLDHLGAPVYVNGMARGCLPPAHPLLMARSRRQALLQADLAVVLGTPFDFRLDYGRSISPSAKIVQVDLDGADIGRNRRVDVPMASDSGLFLQALAGKVSRQSRAPWCDTLRALENKSREKMRAEIESQSDPPNPLRVCAELGKRLKPNDVIIGDGGDFVATAANVLGLAWPQVWMDPGPLGTLGVGPGYAMAAKLARPDANVFIVFGDGSFGFHALEFEAMVRQKIPVIALIGNDAAWTQIRRGQVDIYGEARAVATGLNYTRYDQVVAALGGHGSYVERAEEIGPALDRAIASGLPACVNVRIASSEFRKGAISV